MRARVLGLAGAAVVMVGLAGCGSSHRAAVPRASQSLAVPPAVTADHWHPPSTAGGPSAGTFCRALVADFEHVQQSSIATTPAVRTRIVEDFVGFTPSVEAAAPPDVAASATTYLNGIAGVLKILVQSNFDATKAPRGSIGNILFNGTVTSAGSELRAWSLQHCNYDITAAG